MRQILDAINAAPSAGDLQAYEVVIVTEDAAKDALTKAAYNQEVISQAPVALVFCADHKRSSVKYGKRGADLYAVQDATIAAAYCQLAATALGLATVWVGAFDTTLVAEAIKAPDYVTPVAIIPIGYAAEEPEPTPRRDVFDLIRDNRF
jgi:nitroreductase